MNLEFMQKYCILLCFCGIGSSSAFLGGLGMLHLGSKKLEKPVFLLCFLCVVVGAHGLGCSCGGGCGRRWLVVDRSSGGRRLVVGGWSSAVVGGMPEPALKF